MDHLNDTVTTAITHMTEDSLRRNEERLQKNQKSIESASRGKLYRETAMRDQARIEHEKDLAFFSWYKAPEGCDQWESDREMVECTNNSMRARRDFEKLWVEGKIE